LICKVYPILQKSPLLRILTPTICYWKCSLDKVGFADRTRIGDTGVIELMKTEVAGPIGSDFRLLKDIFASLSYPDSSVLAVKQYPRRQGFTAYRVGHGVQ
jgi:hypothetical protein